MQEGLLSMWLIENGYREPDTTISKVAQIIHTNRSYLMQYFKQKYGMSFTTRMNQLRIEDAKQLMLENKEMTMAEIAFQIGYASGSYFTHVFSIYEGVAPAKWRVEQQDNEI
jgi:YesN/AraC family two-component response regulator